jgi:hypothetical protein
MHGIVLHFTYRCVYREMRFSMRFFLSFILFALLVLSASCQEATPVCPPTTQTPQYLTVPPEKLPTPTPVSEARSVVIGRSERQVNKVVEGPLCNDRWSGTVYVTCNVQVYPWVEEPTFLKDCQLNIEPQTVVYVAYHNNTAYYNGCSCHTGLTPEP